LVKLEIYSKYYPAKNLNELVDAFQKTLVPTNRTPEFYVDWQKVKQNLDEIKIELSLWNSLINSNNIKADFKDLIIKYPEVIKTIPILHAIREREFPVIIDFQTETTIKKLDFNKSRNSKLSEEELNYYVEFAMKSGVFMVFSHVRNFYDYVFGVEVGLDSNARKNRSGEAMETLFEPILKEISAEIGCRILAQRNFESASIYGAKVPTELSKRKADFIVYKEKKFLNIEVNYYAGGGSKPEEIVDSYINRKNELEKHGWGFIWVTDGDAWRVAQNQMKKAFNEMDYVLNIQFARKGLLRDALIQLLS
jgi:type II restriction enzyme